MAKFKISKAKNGEFYFTLHANNGKVVSTSETYKRKATMLKTIGNLLIITGVASCNEYEDTTIKKKGGK